MSEVECPCCKGAGKITVVSSPGRPEGYVTARALAARIGYSHTTIQRHANEGIIKADVGEIVLPYKRHGKTIRQPRVCYLIKREEADRYVAEIERRRKSNIRSRSGRGVEMERMHEQGHSPEVIAERFKVKVLSVKRTLQRRRAK